MKISLRVFTIILTASLLSGCVAISVPLVKAGDTCLVRFIDCDGVHTAIIENTKSLGWIEMQIIDSAPADRVRSPGLHQKSVWINVDRIMWIAPKD